MPNNVSRTRLSFGEPSERLEFAVQPPLLGALRVAAIYAGRWWGASASSHIADDHLANFIRPNNVHVFVVTDPPSWCAASAETRAAYRAGDIAAAQVEFVRQVTDAFRGWPKLHAALVPAEDRDQPHEYGRASMRAADAVLPVGQPKARAAIYMHRWYMQYEHVARAELFRRAFGPHDVIVRLRLDVKLNLPLTLTVSRDQIVRAVVNATTQVIRFRRDTPEQGGGASADAVATPRPPLPQPQLGSYGYWRVDAGAKSGPSTVPCVPRADEPLILAGQRRGHYNRVARCPEGRPLQWMWSDWLEVGTPRSFEVFASMTRLGTIYATHDSRVRCYGLCPEEQNVFQLEARGVRMLPMNLPLTLHKITSAPCGTEPLLNMSELAEQHRISPWYSLCLMRKSRPCSR